MNPHTESVIPVISVTRMEVTNYGSQTIGRRRIPCYALLITAIVKVSQQPL